MGRQYQHIRYSMEIDKNYPSIKYTVPYKDPIFAIVTIEPDGILKIEGKSTEYVGPSPEEIGYPVKENGNIIAPRITDRIFEF